MRKPGFALLLLAILAVAVWLGLAWFGRPGDADTEVTGPTGPVEELAAPAEDGEITLDPGLDAPVLDDLIPGPDRREPVTPEAPVEAPVEEPPTRDLRVLLVGPGGEAVPDAPVHVVTELPFALGRLQDNHAADTGVNGTAVLEDSARLLDATFHAPEEGNPYLPVRLGVRCGLSPGNEKSGLDETWIVWLEAEPEPGEVVRVTCPPLSWIQVDVTPDPVATEHSSAPFWAFWIRMEDGERSAPRGGGPFESGASTHRIGPFAAGWVIDVTLSRLGRVDALGYQRVVLPTTHGEVVHVTFEEPASTWISGRARHPSGEAFADEQLRAYLGDPDEGARGGVRLGTDAEGHWSMGVPRDAVGDLIVLLASGATPAPRGEVPVSLPQLDGTAVDVGEVVIHPRASDDRLLAAGRVRAEDGTPLASVWVSAYVVTDEGTESQPTARVRTDSRGEYELVSSDELAGTEIEVYAWRREYLRPERLRVPVGSRAVDFTLLPGGAVTGEILMDAGVNPEQIVVRFEGEGRSRTVSITEFQFQEKGAFAGLVPGSYEVRFEIRKTDWVLLETGGELLDIERLDLGPFDLRGKVRALELRLADASGAPIANERFELVDPDLVGYSSLQSDDAGRVHCLVPSEPTTFLFGNLKYGAHTIAASSDPIELVLEE